MPARAAAVTLIGDAVRAPDLVIMGSHDVALDVVIGALGEFHARTIAVGSQGGVHAASRGECDIAPVHLVDPATGIYNKHLVTPGLTLIPGWRRMQGFVFREVDARFAGMTADAAIKAALADPSVLMVNRNAGSGTRVLVDGLLRGARPAGYANQPRSHNAVATAIAQNRADWGVAIEPVARMYGLSFLPIAPEHYDFLLVEARRDASGGAGIPRGFARRDCPRPHSRARHGTFSVVIPGRRVAASPESITTIGAVVYVYLLASAKHGTLYVGVTNDLIRRVYQHRTHAARGFTSRYRVHRLVWFESYDDPLTAITREKEIKKWRRDWKVNLIEASNPEWADLYEKISL